MRKEQAFDSRRKILQEKTRRSTSFYFGSLKLISYFSLHYHGCWILFWIFLEVGSKKNFTFIISAYQEDSNKFGIRHLVQTFSAFWYNLHQIAAVAVRLRYFSIYGQSYAARATLPVLLRDFLRLGIFCTERLYLQYDSGIFWFWNISMRIYVCGCFHYDEIYFVGSVVAFFRNFLPLETFLWKSCGCSII